jgi:hypothetical protein
MKNLICERKVDTRHTVMWSCALVIAVRWGKHVYRIWRRTFWTCSTAVKIHDVYNR